MVTEASLRGILQWKRLYLSTEPIKQVRAAAAIKGAYAVMKKPEPEVVFCSSPQAALNLLREHVATANIPNIDSNLGPDGFPRDFSQFFLQTALQVIKTKKKQQQAGIKPLHDLRLKVMNNPQKRIGKHINRRLPKDVSVRDVAEQAFSSNGLFEQMRQNAHREKGVRNPSPFSDTQNDFSVQDWAKIESQLS